MSYEQPLELRRFQKRPVKVEAVQWDGSAAGATPIIDWILRCGGTATYWCVDPDDCTERHGDSSHVLKINTLEGAMHALPGWWVIRGVEGEFYGCKASVFDASYEQPRDHVSLQQDLQGAIRASGRSQREVAADLDMSPKHLSSLMTGRTRLTVDQAAALAAACGMRLHVALLPDGDGER